MESDHGEHLLSERRLVMGHCPRAHQRSRDIIGHEWSAQGPLNSPVGRTACAHPPHRGGSPVGYRNARALPPEEADRKRAQRPKPVRGPMRRAHQLPRGPCKTYILGFSLLARIRDSVADQYDYSQIYRWPKEASRTVCRARQWAGPPLGTSRSARSATKGGRPNASTSTRAMCSLHERYRRGRSQGCSSMTNHFTEVKERRPRFGLCRHCESTRRESDGSKRQERKTTPVSSLHVLSF